MYSIKANRNELENTNNNKSVPDIKISAADINSDIVRGMDVVMAECNGDDLKLPAAASGGPSPQTQAQTDQDAVMTEKERIFMSELNRMIDQYNAENKQQADASMPCLPQKRPGSSFAVTHKRRKESTGMLHKKTSLKFILISNIKTHFVSLLLLLSLYLFSDE